MKKFFLLILALCTFLSSTILAQAPLKQWDLDLGSGQADILYCGIQTSDGGYFAGGNTVSDIGDDITEPTRGNDDYWVVKLNANGTKAWDKRFGGNGSDGLRSVKQTSDGGYIVAGWSMSILSGDKTQESRGGSDFWVVKTSSTGIKEWDVRFGGDLDEYLSDIILTPDGGYLLGGRSISNISGDKTEAGRGSEDYWVVKISSTGVKQWDKRFGGSSSDMLTSLAVASDGGYLMGGYSNSQISGDKTQARSGTYDYWVVKINNSGIKQWDATLGGSGSDLMTSMKSTSDGGFILGGYSNSTISGNKTQNSNGMDDYWIAKISGTGTFEWDATFGGSANDQLFSIEQTTDGGYLIGGSSDSPNDGDKTITSRGYSDFWALKLNSSGVKQWDVAYGGDEPDHLQKLQSTSDGGYVFFGYSWSGVSGDKTSATKYNIDYWIVKAGSTATTAINTGILSAPMACPGMQVSVPYTVTGTFNPGNVFTAQLSDPVGNFTTPTEIGTLIGVGSGTIEAMIPLNAAGGPGYRIRVVSSNPSIIGSPNGSDLGITTAPVPTISVNGAVLTSSPAPYYQWFLNDSAIENANAQTYTAIENGEYRVAVMDITGCFAISLPQTIIVTSPTTFISVNSVLPTTFCAGQLLSISFTADGDFFPGNEFIAELSDQTGNFANATIIGILNGISSGTFEVSIPPTVAAGSGYRIRVNANNPFTIGTANGNPLTVNTAVTPTITVSGTILTSSVAQSYQWCLNGEPIDGASSQSYTVTQDGDYTVIILDNAGCMAISAVQTITNGTPPPIDPCGTNPTYTFSLVKDIVSSPSYSSSSPRCFYKVADHKIFFCAKDPASNTESLYFTNGTASGTVLLKANLTPSDIGNPVYSSMFATFNGKMCFVGKENSAGQFNQVWISDGTPAGTYALTSFTNNLSISQLTVHNQKLYFKAYFGPDALFESNGTPNSATIIENIVFADRSCTFKTWNTKLYLITKSKVYDYSNNTRELIYNYFDTHSGCIAGCEIVNGKLIYQSDVNCTSGESTYRDIYEVDLQTGAEQSLSTTVKFSNPVDYFREAIVFKNAVYFYYNNNGIANEINDEAYIYKYDGGALSLVHTHVIDSADITFSGFTTDGNRLLYTISVQSNKVQAKPASWSVLYETNGTASGLKKLFDKTGNQYYNEGGSTYSPNRLCILGNKVFFHADSLPYTSYPVSTLFYHDGVNAHKILPSADIEDFNALEMVSLSESEVFVEVYMDVRIGLGVGAEPYLLSCNGTGPIGFEEPTTNKHFAVYPNPTNGKIKVDIEAGTATKITVFNLVGELILTTTNSTEVDLSLFCSGIYLLEIESGSSIERHKVVLMGK